MMCSLSSRIRRLFSAYMSRISLTEGRRGCTVGRCQVLLGVAAVVYLQDLLAFVLVLLQ